ncbi:MAG: hypothetical protein HYU65_09955, partial [Armatimonadetes bacterium]|nr:hypothetical protein [Armatimonadota bacterium]
MKSRRWVIAGAIMLGGLLLAAGYIVQQTYTPPASATAPVTPEVRQFSLHLLVSKEGDRVVRHWIPSAIVVNARDTVILRITNGDDESAHGFSLGALNVVMPPIPPGQTVTVRFTATRPGIFHHGCNVVGFAIDHADQ